MHSSRKLQPAKTDIPIGQGSSLVNIRPLSILFVDCWTARRAKLISANFFPMSCNPWIKRFAYPSTKTAISKLPNIPNAESLIATDVYTETMATNPNVRVPTLNCRIKHSDSSKVTQDGTSLTNEPTDAAFPSRNAMIATMLGPNPQHQESKPYRSPNTTTGQARALESKPVALLFFSNMVATKEAKRIVVMDVKCQSKMPGCHPKNSMAVKRVIAMENATRSRSVCPDMASRIL
mmetsp:Transcript_8483/g.17564  ORF Transcript_8483/g.17564 Transcript_8483/m.17564 type:complete len:235 (-) Transcript_8483:237-941(-)